MTQQINLLTAQFRKQRRSLTSAAVLGPALVVAPLLGLAAYGYLFQQVKGLRTELAQIEQTLKAEQEKQLKVTQDFAARKRDTGLEAEVRRLERQLVARRTSLQALTSGAIGNTSGFSESMHGFARQSLDGLWLTGFDLTGTEISVEGRALRAELVPQYIKRLANESAFSGRNFSALAIGQPQADPRIDSQISSPYLSFRLTAKGGEMRAGKDVDVVAVGRP